MKKWQCNDCDSKCKLISNEDITPNWCVDELNTRLDCAWIIKQTTPELATKEEIIEMCQEIIKKLK